MNVLHFAQIDHKVGVNAFPAYPRLYKCGSTIQSIGERLGSEFGITLSRCDIECYRLAGSKVCGTALQIARAIEFAVVHGMIVALVDGGHIIFFHATFEEVEFASYIVVILNALSTLDFEFGVLQRQTRKAHAVEIFLLACHSSFGLVEEFVIGATAIGIEHTVLVSYGRIVNPQFFAARQQCSLEFLLILIDIWSSLTIVAVHKCAHKRVAVEVGVPHQFAHHIGAHLGEIAASRTCYLREVHGNVILLEKLDILLYYRKVGERRKIVVEIDAVVPHENVVRDFSPTFESGHKVAPRSIVSEGHFALAVDIAEHDVDIWQRFHMLGRMHGEKVGERAELLVGESLGKAVHKANEVARQGAFVIVYRLTIRAVAIGKITVILTHRNHVFAGIGAED